MRRFVGAVNPWFAALCAIGFTLALAHRFGFDNNWDQLNFHFYAPLNLQPGRLAADFMGGSTSGYHNPLPYLPFHWLVLADASPRLIVTVLALLHALNAVLVFHLARAICADWTGDSVGTACAWIAMAMTLSSSCYAMLVATTFADILVSIPVLAGWLCVMRAFRQPTPSGRWLVVSGALAGTGLALKLSVIHCVAGIGIGVLVMMRNGGQGARGGLLVAVAWGAGLLAGFLAVNGFWMLRLWQEYANPFFPLFNTLFQSPDYPTASAPPHNRFTDLSLLGLLTLPFRMTLPEAGVFSEKVAVDLRFALLAMLALYMGACAINKRLGTYAGATRGSIDAIRMPRALLLGSTIAAASFVLWGWHSANARYGLPLVFGISAVAVALPLWLFRTRLAVGLALCLLLAGARYAYDVGNNRWSEEPWRERWYALSIPDALRAPDLMLVSVDLQTNSFVIPFLHASTKAINLSQPPRLSPGVWGGHRAERLIDAHRGGLWLLAKAPPANARNPDEVEAAERLYADWLASVEALLRAFGLSVRSSACQPVMQQSGPPGQRLPDAAMVRIGFRGALMACPLERVAKIAHRSPEVDRIFERVEARFPSVFPPGTSATHPWPEGHARQYLATDAFLVVKRDGWIYGRRRFRGETETIGQVSDFAN
jgi:hypothetical protein